MSGRHVLRRALPWLLCILAASAPAQTYPTRPVRLVSPYPPGSSADFVSRLYAPKLAEALGQQFIVDNRGGAAGNIGAEVVARATPDGYTLLTAPAALASSASLYKNLSFKLARDFEPIALLTTSPQVLAVRLGLPAKSIRELIALAKSRPGHLTFGSTGSGGSPHLAMEMLKMRAGIELVHVPYKGSAMAIPDLIGGQTDVMFGSIISLYPHAKAGRVRALGISSAQRSPAAPDLPTVAESGFPGFEAGSWSAMLAPAGTPRPIVTLLGETLAKIGRMPDVIERITVQGGAPLSGTPAQTRAFIESEIAKWGKVIAAAGIRAD